MKIRIHKEHLKREILTFPVISTGIAAAAGYLIISSLFMNYALIIETVTGNYSLSEKIAVLFMLLTGITSLYSPGELLLIGGMGFLMGINTVLLFKSLQERKRSGTWSFGLGILGTVATTGCASCGITFLSFAGPSLSLSILPFQGIFLQTASIILLMVSLIHTLNKRSTACVVVR